MPPSDPGPSASWELKGRKREFLAVSFAVGTPATPAHSPAGRKRRRGDVAVHVGRLAGEK